MSVHGDDRGSGLVSILTLLSALVGTAVVAGLVGAGLFMPAVGAVGATARTGVDFFDALPAELEQSPLAQQSRILDADGHVIATFYNENRVVVPLKKIAPIMREAQIAIEDTRFREHGGIDPKGVLRAMVNNASGDSTQGASTLTQQYVKLTLQENALYAGDEEGAKAAVDKNVARKIQEMKFAVALEKQMTKDQILEGYLNIAYFGDGAYGVETAARHFFSTSAAKLTLPQAALLAGLVQQPGAFDPRRNPKAAITRRNVVLSRMQETGVITQKQHDAAVKTKLGLKISAAGNGCDSSAYPFFCNYVYRQVLTNKVFGATEQARRTLVFRGGLTIRTTLQPKVQAAAQQAVHDKVAPRNKSNVAAAISVVEPGTGKVLAMAQSRPFGRNTKKGQTVVNYNTDSAYGSSKGFQPGSTFKAFTLAAALADGKSLNTVVNAPRGGTTFPRSDFDSNGCWPYSLADDYAPFNSEGREVGNYTLRKITEDSVNTGFVRLEAEIGVCKVKAMAENVGMHGAVTDLRSLHKGDKPTDEIRPQPSMTLGAQEVAPLTVAAAYASFAADGVYCQPISITSATTLAGKAIAVPKPVCQEAMDQNIARGVTAALQDVIKSGTAARVQKIGRPAAGKTGTANASRATWFTGYTPQIAASVWFGNPDASKPMKNIDTGKDYYPRQIYGATVAAPIWASFMKAATQGMPVENFAKASDKVVYGDRVTVPGTTGMSIADATKVLEDAGFRVSVGGPKPSAVPAGFVAESNPAGGSRSTSGSSVTIYPSTGTPPVVSPGPTPSGPPTGPKKGKGPGKK
jgi:membrane peptidoglycan carboxypeptidase